MPDPPVPVLMLYDPEEFWAAVRTTVREEMAAVHAGYNGFISAYRKHQRDGSFEIRLDYISCPELEDRVVIVSDPMLATVASLVKTIQYLREEGHPAEIHVVVAIACTVGIEYVLREEPQCRIWCGAIDDELTAKGFIVPGLGDAGALAYGNKVQM